MAQKRTSKSKKKAESEKPASFEAAMERLEAIVDGLEEGELELEASLVAFEEGVKLSRQCASYLRDAERKIDLLVREGEELVGAPLDPGGSFDEEELSRGEEA